MFFRRVRRARTPKHPEQQPQKTHTYAHSSPSPAAWPGAGGSPRGTWPPRASAPPTSGAAASGGSPRGGAPGRRRPGWRLYCVCGGVCFWLGRGRVCLGGGVGFVFIQRHALCVGLCRHRDIHPQNHVYNTYRVHQAEARRDLGQEGVHQARPALAIAPIPPPSAAGDTGGGGPDVAAVGGGGGGGGGGVAVEARGEGGEVVGEVGDGLFLGAEVPPAVLVLLRFDRSVGFLLRLRLSIQTYRHISRSTPSSTLSFSLLTWGQPQRSAPGPAAQSTSGS